MNRPAPFSCLILVIAAAFFGVIPGFPAASEASIAKVAKVSGEVLLRSGGELTRLTTAGGRLNDGDQIQVKQGEAEILFTDGALLRVNAFSNALLQERQEEGGFWIFKTKVAARRITCLVGKLFFQSGASGLKNYLQTPTAVAGIRGSSGDVGFDNLNSYLNMYVGQALVVGPMVQGFFQNPGSTAAQRSAVYQALSTAAEQTRQAEASGRTLEIAQAKVAALQVVTRVAELLQTNPDPVVRTDAVLARAASSAAIGAATALVSVEQIRADQARAEAAAAEAGQKGETLQAQKAAEAAGKAEQSLAAAEQAARQAAAAANKAAAAADQRDPAAAQSAAQAAQTAAQQATAAAQEIRKQIQNVAPTTVPATTAETTAATTTAVTTTAAATTAETTTATTGETTAPTTVPTTVLTTVTTTVPTTVTTTTSTTTTSSSTSSIAPSP
jgi:hypothetical protein